MNKIIEENYKSIVLRGLITPQTTESEFISKLDEEVKELKQSILNNDIQNKGQEMADVILVVLAYAKHVKIDIEKEIKDKIQINFKRAENGQ